MAQANTSSKRSPRPSEDAIDIPDINSVIISGFPASKHCRVLLLPIPGTYEHHDAALIPFTKTNQVYHQRADTTVEVVGSHESQGATQAYLSCPALLLACEFEQSIHLTTPAAAESFSFQSIAGKVVLTNKTKRANAIISSHGVQSVVKPGKQHTLNLGRLTMRVVDNDYQLMVIEATKSETLLRQIDLSPKPHQHKRFRRGDFSAVEATARSLQALTSEQQLRSSTDDGPQTSRPSILVLNTQRALAKFATYYTPHTSDVVLFKNKHTLVKTASLGGRLVVTKHLYRADRSREKQVEVFAKETRILSMLKHDHIVQQISSDLDTFTITFEHLPGHSLAQFMKTPTGQSILRFVAPTVFEHTAKALEYVHNDHGFAHNDVKPDNIMLYTIGEQRFHAKLIDFGLATESKHHEMAGGTEHFVAPEWLLEGRRGFPGDIWAFGVTTLMILGALRRPPLREGWLIAHIHPRRRSDHEDAATKMLAWVDEVTQAQKRLRDFPLVGEMLHEVKKRITSKDIVLWLSKSFAIPGPSIEVEVPENAYFLEPDDGTVTSIRRLFQ